MGSFGMSAEWEAPVTSKMSELQEAMNRYGASSVRNYQTIHPIGEKLIEGFGTYLGVPGCVLGSYVKDVFVHPVSYFEAERTGKIGFLAKVD